MIRIYFVIYEQVYVSQCANVNLKSDGNGIGKYSRYKHVSLKIGNLRHS